MQNKNWTWSMWSRTKRRKMYRKASHAECGVLGVEVVGSKRDLII